MKEEKDDEGGSTIDPQFVELDLLHCRNVSNFVEDVLYEFGIHQQ